MLPFPLTEPRNSGLELFNGGGAVVVVGDESVEPAAKLVLLLQESKVLFGFSSWDQPG